MNPTSPTPWECLAAAARRAPASSARVAESESAPVGFATRVVARADLRPSTGLFVSATFERLAARALACSCAGAVAVAVWSSLPTHVTATPLDSAAATSDAYLDPVGAILETVQF